MSERAAYSRVYWMIVDDDKFRHVYDDDAALASWLRLLLVADQAWPSSAHVPSTTRQKSLKVLADAGLVDVQQGGRYRIHGLDAERTRRRDAATRGPRRDDQLPPNWDPGGTQAGPERDPSGPYTPGLSREGDENKTRKDEEDARATDNGELDGPTAYHQVTQRYPEYRSELHAWVTMLAEGYGAETFHDALIAEYTANAQLNDLVSRTQARLAQEADRRRKRNPVTFDRAAWVEQKRREQEERYSNQGGAA